MLKQTKFNQDEFDVFGIPGLQYDNFIKVGDRYFEPAAIVPRNGWSHHGFYASVSMSSTGPPLIPTGLPCRTPEPSIPRADPA